MTGRPVMGWSWLRGFVLGWALILVGGTLAPAGVQADEPWNIDVLMQGLAAHQPRQADYTEEKYLGVLDTPLVSSGTLTYRAPDTLEKRTVSPRPAVMTLSGQTLSVTEDQHTQTLDLTAHPDAAAYVDSLRGLLSGNLALLKRFFSLQLTGDRDHWTLVLRPSGGRIGSLIDSISVTGSGYLMRTLEYDQSDGDRSVMTIKPKAHS